MDTQADQPSGGADPSEGSPPGGGQPRTSTPASDSGQQGGGTPLPSSDQPWAGAPQPGGAQQWGGPPQPSGQYPGQPPIIAGTGTGRPRVRPGRIWYLVPALLIAGGIASVVFGFVSLSGKVDSFARVP